MPDAPGRLWLVTRVYAPDEGGVQTYAAEVARAYAALGWQVTLFVKSSAGPRRETDGRLTKIDVGPGSKLRVYARLLGAMAAAWREGERPEAIHACTWRAAIPALFFRRRLIVTVHGREIGRPRGLAFRLMRLVLARSERVVAVSETTRELLLRRLPQFEARCVVAWNGISTAVVAATGAARTGEGEPGVLTLCRLVPRKNIVTAVKAAASCYDRGLRFHYRIAGRGPQAAEIRHAIDASGAGSRIALLGYVGDRQREVEFRQAEIFLHPQLALEAGDEIEGFGISIADAMAHGLVCIVGAEGGPAELIQHDVTGFVVDARSEAAIAAVLERVLLDSTLRSRMGEAARCWVGENLSWHHHCRISLDRRPAPRAGQRSQERWQ
ncbi:glycosyltransferase family 4 protein [Siccirubricoccus sp. KC 17139]|uniref:Glycosyltransferase family 4 protein n=1 Tax=Siccirubricoccus soli TaxID=2899147 RepID=A0ABT1D328_9PROT|nr:glycosyltransferase family 4 protein [Siccirubricoccus soli]MCP2682144.1 glycosyltransferase family 4 protein [Siccirubricoccus soli]